MKQFRKPLKKVYQYDMGNNFIKEWNSVQEVYDNLRITKSDINLVCNIGKNMKSKSKRKSAGGYIWKYK